MIDSSEMDRRFDYHNPGPAKGETALRHLNVRMAAKMFAQAIEDLCPEGREKALAITNLEQAMMWGNASIARSGGSEQPERASGATKGGRERQGAYGGYNGEKAARVAFAALAGVCGVELPPIEEIAEHLSMTAIDEITRFVKEKMAGKDNF